MLDDLKRYGVGARSARDVDQACMRDPNVVVTVRSSGTKMPLSEVVMVIPAGALIQRAEAASTPKAFEPRWRQLGVAHRVLDVLVPEIGLQRPRVVALIGQRITAGVPQHMRVDLEANLGFVAGAGQQLGKAGRGEGTAAL
jgi:hypothetical protein